MISTEQFFPLSEIVGKNNGIGYHIKNLFLKILYLGDN